MPPLSLPDEVRAATAWVAERSRQVRIEHGEVAAYVATLPEEAATAGPEEVAWEDRETAAAFVICLDAINFGSGWWPTIRRRPGRSGYATVAAGVRDRFRRQGPWSPEELLEIDAEAVAGVLGQDAEHPLMAQFAAALRDLGSHVGREHGGSFEAVADSVASAPALARVFARWDCFADVSRYRGRQVPFYKRAQIAAADLHRAGVVELSDLDRLTAFADNLVPHVLRIDGVLRLEPPLAEAIEAGRLLEHGSTAEVELRACAVRAVELIAESSPLCPAEIDSLLWNRGRHPRYKARPRPRSRNTAY